MFTTTRILVPLDGSDLSKQAIAYALALAGDSARITLLQVVHTGAVVRDAAGSERISDDPVDRWIAEQSHRFLDNVATEARRIAPIGVEIATVVASGDPASGILQAAADRHEELIVMTSHARGAFGRAAYGSVADRVARTAEIPVVITRPEMEGTDVTRLIVPLDGSARSQEAVPVASRLARRLGVPIHLAHVIDTFSSYMAVTGAPISQPILDEWYADSKTMLEAAAGELRKAGIDATFAVYQGSTFDNLTTIAEPGNMIVMTSHGRSGFTRWFLGSTAEKLVRLAPVPVCLVPARHPVPAAVVEYVNDTTVEALSM